MTLDHPFLEYISKIYTRYKNSFFIDLQVWLTAKIKSYKITQLWFSKLQEIKDSVKWNLYNHLFLLLIKQSKVSKLLGIIWKLKKLSWSSYSWQWPEKWFTAKRSGMLLCTGKWVLMPSRKAPLNTILYHLITCNLRFRFFSEKLSGSKDVPQKVLIIERPMTPSWKEKM